jgi:phosphopantetheinyl transferase (holo-ACP synthase)
VERIEKKFMSAAESSFIQMNEKVEHLIVCWSIKETIFKLLEIPGLLFSKEILISPFTLKDEKVRVKVSHNSIESDFIVYFRRIQNVFITWCIA